MNLDDFVGALRATDGADGDGNDAELADATRLRLRRSLESRARSSHQLAGLATTIAILSVGTASWALATGRATALWAPAAAVVAPEEPAPPVTPPRPSRRGPPKTPSIVVPVEPAPAEQAAEPPPAEPPPAEPLVEPAVEPAPAPAAPAAPAVDALYRRAHDLHFRGGDPSYALSAWDAYLAAQPAGQFAVEARYNRAIALVRLRRFAEARTALAPFARGEVADGYRQAEAAQLVERLSEYP